MSDCPLPARGMIKLCQWLERFNSPSSPDARGVLVSLLALCPESGLVADDQPLNTPILPDTESA